MKYFIVVFLAIFGACHSITTVTELNVDNYVGRWYQTLENQWTKITNRERNNVCITATYEKINETYVDVLNAGRDYIPTGPSVNITGYAYVPDVKQPGKLKVVLKGVPVEGDYWVTKLGPLRNNQYQYSIVTSSKARPLYVLARNVDEYYQLYDAEVQKYLAEQGFVGLLKAPKKVLHTDDCIYPPGYP